MHKHKTVKFDEVGERTATKQLNKLKRVENFIQLISQPIFSEASQTKWGEPFDFPTEIFGFLMHMVSTPDEGFFVFNKLDKMLRTCRSFYV